MSTDRTKLALRRQSIRILTPSELSIAHGGNLTGSGNKGQPSRTKSGDTSVTLGTAPTLTATDLPQTRTVA
jgi:hypothetical protein